jgi:hypothetical protein
VLTSLALLAFLAADQAPVAPSPEPEKQSCRREVVTGSNLSKRICHSKDEWKALDQARRAAADRERAVGGGMGRGRN